VGRTHHEGAIICTATELKKAGIPGRTGQHLGAMDIDFNRLLADAARELAEELSIVTTLERVVDLCTETMQACTAAGVTVVQAGEIRTLAATDAVLVVVDQLQMTLGQGPAHAALDRQEAVVVVDLGSDPRWPDWGRRVVADAGLRALLGFRLFTSDGSAGVLNLYASESGAFDPEDLLEGQVLAARASVALATTRKERQLHQALQHRTVIGQGPAS
jgi:transcriptional regulator with GAF, ATPase, and Fis domain